MPLEKSLSLEVYKLGNGKTILCQIKVKPRTIKIDSKSEKKVLRRWFKGFIYWSIFESNIENIVDKLETDKSLNHQSGKFYIDNCILVNYKTFKSDKSNLCCSHIESFGLQPGEPKLVFDCEIEYVTKTRTKLRNNTETNKNALVRSQSDNKCIEYQPEYCTTTYEPYTPSRKKRKNSCLARTDDEACAASGDERYSPSPVNSSEKRPITPIPPLYKASRIERAAASDIKKSDVDTRVTRFKRIASCDGPRAVSKVLEKDFKSKNEVRAEQYKSNNKKPIVEKNRVRSSSKESSSSNSKSNEFEEDTRYFRISTRSTSTRTTQKITNSMKHKKDVELSKPKNIDMKYLFGSDTDDDEDNETEKFVKTNQQIIENYNEELNTLYRAAKTVVVEKPPEKVDLLSLSDKSSDDVLNSFEGYKKHFDKVLKDLQHTNYVENYNGLRHMHIVNFLDARLQNDMMNKVAKFYKKPVNGQTATQLTNAILPTWITLMLMDKYKMEYQEVANHLIAQQKYEDYLNIDLNGTCDLH